MPPHLTADEKHTRHKKQKAYLAVTAAKGCLLGSELCAGAGYEELTAGYGVFQEEVTHHIPDYQPETVTLDGWEATRQAWETCFPGITWILCFLHEVIKVRNLCRSKSELWTQLREKLWHIYHGESKREFAQRLRRFLEWADAQELRPSIQSRIQRLKTKSPQFQKAYDFEAAPRTSNAVDRPMNYLDRSLFSMQYFHGSWEAAVQAGHVQTPEKGWGRNWRFDKKRRTAQIDAPGSAISDLTLNLEPMIGSIGVAPPLNMALYAGDLWIHGGNIDYRRMREGTTLYLPVHRSGAYLVLGDGHALQGDGEISGQGLETSLNVEFEIDLIPDQRLPYLWSEDKEFVMVHGIDNTLDKALQAATTGMTQWLKSNYGLNDSEIAALLSPTINYDIAVIVNSRPHVVARIPKRILEMIERRED